MRKKARRLVILLRICWVSILLYASLLSGYAAESVLDFWTITTQNGLSHNMVKTLFQDQRGFMWIGTHNGLNRFDGVDIQSYPDFNNLSVSAVSEKDSINLWIGTDEGLWVLNRKTEKTQKIELGEDIAVTDLSQAQGDNVLAATEHGLYIVKDGSAKRILFNQDVLSPENKLYQIVRDANGKDYWIASADGLIRFNWESGQYRIFKSSGKQVNANYFICLAQAGNTIYIGTKDQGMQVFDILTSRFSTYIDLKSTYITTLFVDKDLLYVGTDGNGVKIVSIPGRKVIGTIEHSAASKRSLSSNAIYAFLYKNGIFWIGTFLGGLNYIPTRGHLFSVYASSLFDSRQYNIRSLYCLENGDKVIGTREGLFYISETRHFVKQFSSSNSALRSDIIFAIRPYGTDFVVGTREGLYLLNVHTMTLTPFQGPQAFQKQVFPVMTNGKNGDVWIGCDDGLFLCRPGKGVYRTYNQTNSVLTNPSVHALLLDSRNRLWISNAESIYIYDQNVNRFLSETSLPRAVGQLKNVEYMYEDRKHNIWLCTDKDGVYRLDQHLSKLQKVESGNFFENNLIVGMQEDNNGLWISSRRGLICYNTATGQYKLFSLYDGLPGYIFNSAFRTADGTLWWGNENGLVSYNKQQNLNHSEGELYAPAITSIYVSGRKLHAGDRLLKYAADFVKEIVLPAEDNNLRLNFTSLNYPIENADIYEYCLEGYDKTWRNLMQGNAVSYENLPAGYYTFRVRSSFNPGKEAVIRVVVRPLWFNWIFPVVLCLMIGGVGFFFYYRLWHKYRLLGLEDMKNAHKEKYAGVKLDKGRSEVIRAALLDYMEKDAPYLNPDLKRSDVAQHIHCTPDELSQVMNGYLHTNFTDFINTYRVEAFIKNVHDPEMMKFTLASLAEKSGFNSKSSFFRSFKKLKGTTPLEYLKNKSK